MRRSAEFGDGWMPYLYSAERYARSVATIRELAEKRGRSLEAFAWMAYVMISVATDGAEARALVADFLG